MSADEPKLYDYVAVVKALLREHYGAKTDAEVLEIQARERPKFQLRKVKP